jgi:hypothetical protein
MNSKAARRLEDMISTVFDKRCYVPSFYKILFKINIMLHEISGKKMNLGVGVGRGGG